MSNEERLRLRKLAQKENTKEEAVAEDGTASTVSAPIAVVDTKSLTNSTTTAATEQQEEAETSEVSKEVIEGSGHTEDFLSSFIPPPELRHSPQLQTLQAWIGWVLCFWSHGFQYRRKTEVLLFWSRFADGVPILVEALTDGIDQGGLDWQGRT
jgi:hypothetical protein